MLLILLGSADKSRAFPALDLVPARRTPPMEHVAGPVDEAARVDDDSVQLQAAGGSAGCTKA